jgi:hypothetical protein
MTEGLSEEDLLDLFKKLNDLEYHFLNEVKLFVKIEGKNENVQSVDLFISAIVNRSISIIQGFLTLASNNNYISAVPLIRIQIDNCLRFYAITLVENYDIFFADYLKGLHISNMKDSSGNKMNDTYLVTKLDSEVFPGIRKLYTNTSGYIHFSNEHAFLQTQLVKDKERTIVTCIGNYDFFSIDKKCDIVYNMLKVSEMLLFLVGTWKYKKIIIIENQIDTQRIL